MKNILIRFFRRLGNRCVVCGRPIHYTCIFGQKSYIYNYWYCSYTCAGYDGVFNVKKGFIKKPTYSGIVQDYKQFKEN